MHIRQLCFTVVAPLVLASVTIGCGGDGPPGTTYYQRNIEPILLQSCAGNVAGCHVANDDDPFQFAGGNLDVSTFERVQKRRDLLAAFGPYPVPLMLIKAVGVTDELGFNYNGEFRPLLIQHAGGPVLQVGSDAYLTLLTWMENGATENGLPPPAPPREGDGPCATNVPPGFDASEYKAHAEFARFRDKVQPVLESCASGNCHGTPQADFYVTCGDDDDQIAFNFSQVWAFVDDPVDNSQVLQVPLSVTSGGYAHTGGEHFSSRDDASYRVVRDWAELVGKVDFAEGDPGKEFFEDHVQPVLVERGCSLEACHSPQATNDLKMRTGSQDFFASIALERNYDLMKREFLAFEVPDVRLGRAVAKSILPKYGGMNHRGGSVLETPGSGGSLPENCATTYDPATASGYCTFQEWLNVERAALIADDVVLPLGQGDTVPLVYVNRAETHLAGPLEFDTYQPGSDLMVATATVGADGSITAGTPQTILDGCPGTGDRGVVDVRGPDVSFDGTRVAFSMRTSASEPLSVFTVELDGQNCRSITPAQPDVGGIKIHNFDPAWSPDDAWIVFASTRGASGTPSRSRKLFLPQSDIWRMKVDGSEPEAMTFLTNSEVNPQWKRLGQVIMTTEKVSDGFYQLSGRRINWDLTDYHPLLAQRAQSPFADPTDPSVSNPSVGYQQATDVREAFDGNFLIVLSDAGAKGGAGTLAIFNRSVGPFEQGRGDPGYMQSLSIPDAAANGHVGASSTGAYRSPFPLIDGRIMASYATGFSGDLATATSFNWDIVAVHPRTGERQVILGGPGAQVEAVLGLKYPDRSFFINKRQLVFGGSRDSQLAEKNLAQVHFPDAPMVMTLFNANLRRGRPVDDYRTARYIAAYVENPPPAGTTTGNAADGSYQDRTYAGRASLASDGSVKFLAPAGTPLVLELQDADGNALFTMSEEHQLGRGEIISLGIVEKLFNSVCGGCHGSVSGSELDVGVTPDALTGASESLSAGSDPVNLAP